MLENRLVYPSSQESDKQVFNYCRVPVLEQCLTINTIPKLVIEWMI